MAGISILPYETITSGKHNIANKQDKLVSGENIKTINNQSILGEGNLNIQPSKDPDLNSPINFGDAENSAVLKGGNNKATNTNEVALGKYNESNNDTLFSIGIGTSDTDRKNAFEIKQNGDVYINGVENSLQSELTELSESLSEYIKKDEVVFTKDTNENICNDFENHFAHGEKNIIINSSTNTFAYGNRNVAIGVNGRIESNDGIFIGSNGDKDDKLVIGAQGVGDAFIIDKNGNTWLRGFGYFGARRDDNTVEHEYNMLLGIATGTTFAEEEWHPDSEWKNPDFVMERLANWQNAGYTPNVKIRLMSGEIVMVEEINDSNPNIPIFIYSRINNGILEKHSLKFWPDGTVDDNVEIPTAESSVFKAEYGTTTYAEVAEAYTQGKVIHCDCDGYCYVLTSFVGGIAWFVSIVTHTIKMLYLDANGWNKATYYAENTGNKVTTIDANSTDAKYPSAKAVYDALQNVGGSLVFEAVYGTTTYEEIVEARNAGKLVYCIKDGLYYTLVSLKENSKAWFVCTTSNYIDRAFCNHLDSSWTSETLIAESTNNKTKTISEASTDTQYPSAKAVYDFVGKQGVVSQLQGWSVNNDVYSYTMKNVVIGSIPQASIDLFTRVGAVFNEESGYFEMNGLTDISYEEMMDIYTYGNVPTLPNLEQYMPIKAVRTVIPIRANTYYNQNMVSAFQYATLESLYFSKESSPVNTDGLCSDTRYIHTLVIPDYSRGKKLWSRMSQLRVCQIAKINANIELPTSKLLTNESILYMIQNESATSAITITLHADAYDRAMADTEIQTALEAHPNVSLASA